MEAVYGHFGIRRPLNVDPPTIRHGGGLSWALNLARGHVADATQWASHRSLVQPQLRVSQAGTASLVLPSRRYPLCRVSRCNYIMASVLGINSLTTSSSSSPDPELFTPPPSHATLQQVPDVFVIPPEEEHADNPPFCYFDAAMESKKSLSILPDIDALDAALA